jgi:CD63 antigen
MVYSCLQLSGIAILVVCAVVEARYNEYDQFLPHGIFSAPSVLIAVGVIIFVIAFLGCCGVLTENNCMVLTVRIFLPRYEMA